MAMWQPLTVAGQVGARGARVNNGPNKPGDCGDESDDTHVKSSDTMSKSHDDPAACVRPG
jgi:hypothetical protein